MINMELPSTLDLLLSPTLLEDSLLRSMNEETATTLLKNLLQLLHTERTRAAVSIAALAQSGGAHMAQAEQPSAVPADQQPQPDVVMLEVGTPASPQPSAVPANPLASATSPSRKVLLLQKMVLQLLAHIQWRLSVLEEEQFSLSLQHTLMEALLLACRVQGSALTSASASASSQDVEAALFNLETPALFALVIFKRWVLRSIVHLPLPMPVGLKAQIYTGLPKDFQLPSSQVMGMEQGTALLISSMVPLALQILQCLRPSSSSSEMSKTLRQRLCSAPSPKSFSIADVSSEVVCSKAEWTSVAEANWTSSVLFDLANYHFCFEEYSSAFVCVEALRSIGEGKCSRDVDVHILNGLSQATNISKCSASEKFASKIQDQVKPFYSQVNAELDCVFKQTADAEKAVAANLMVRIEMSQPPNINALAQAASRRATEATSDKAKLLFAVASLRGPLQDGPVKRRPVAVAATKATEAKARNPLLRRKHTVSELFRELHPDAILRLVHELSKQSLAPKKLSTRWALEDGASKALLSSLGKESDSDFIFVLLAKAAQLVRVGGAPALPLAGVLLRTVEERCKDRGPVRGVQRHFLVSEVSAIARGQSTQRGHPPRDKLPAIRSMLQEVLSAGAADAVTDSSTVTGLAALINCGDWDFIAQVSAGGNPVLVQLARLLISTALEASSVGGDVKVDCRRNCKAISDLLLPMAKQGASWSSNKRSRDSSSRSVEQQRWLWVVGFVEAIWHPDILAVLAAFFVSLYNCAVEDVSLALKSDFEALVFPPLPPGSASGLSTEAVLAILQSMGQRSGFQTAGWTRLMADVSFSIGNHASAVRYYLQTLALCTSYFQKPCPLDMEWENVVVARMIKSLLALGLNCYAVELCQFQSEMDYSTAFKNLEERGSNDAMDSVYESVWDVALLEYAVSMHTKRGELSRKKRALERIGVLEVNANNNAEILKETAWRKKTSFLRALCTQFL